MEIQTIKTSGIRQKSFVLTPSLKPIKKEGTLYYCETDQARTIIRLGKRISEEFSDLQGKKPVKYSLEYYRSHEEFIKRVKMMIKGGEGLPFLLFLEKER
ncbi:MAG: hypothetical protein ABH849_02960 [Nanoarchaeota archaeon]